MRSTELQDNDEITAGYPVAGKLPDPLPRDQVEKSLRNAAQILTKWQKCLKFHHMGRETG
jgi:hypothetical protein